MIVEPKYRGFICLTAHPTGCAQNVKEQIDYIKKQPAIKNNDVKNVLVIGGSTGYGLASRIAAAFGMGANTLNISFEKLAEKGRTATPGYYNNVAFDRFATEAGLYAHSINGDAFSNEIKQEAIKDIQKNMGKIDLIIYSLASPRRTDPNTGEQYKSVIKPIGQTYHAKTVDFHTKQVTDVSIEPATEQEIHDTIKVMGGEDWELWIDALAKADVLADGFKTLAYSYIGPKVTHAVYLDGTIGAAKVDLERAAKQITDQYSNLHAQAYVSVNKAVVTQASSAIPVVPLYVSSLFKVMKEKDLHENCIEQMYRLYNERLYIDDAVLTDDSDRIRIDDWEMRDDVQSAVDDIWAVVDSENIQSITDIDGYESEFFKLFGFGRDDVDYSVDVEI